jgi:protein TonB
MPVGRLSPPRQVAGRLSMADLPEELRESGFRGRVWVNYRVEADGSVTNCRVTRSSGNRGVDQMTCRLVERRFRYRPARDEVGRPFWGNIEEFHDWESETFMEPPPNRRRRMDW